MCSKESGFINVMPFNLKYFLPYRLRILYVTITHTFSPIYIKQFDLTPSEWRILASLAQFGQVTAKTLGTHSRMHKTKVSRAVCQLNKRGLITKIPNENDLRETFLEISDKGSIIYEKLALQAEEFDNQMMSCLNKQEQQQFTEIIDKLQQHAETNFTE